MMAYDVFVSHAWSYSDRYMDTLRPLDSAAKNLFWFSYRDYSVPKHDPIVAPNEQVRISKLKELLKEQIRQASVIIVPAGMYVNDRFWIQTEIELARTAFSKPKPIVALRRRGQQRDPEDLMSIADARINWNSNSLAESIRALCV
jgi:hypothetical protein